MKHTSGPWGAKPHGAIVGGPYIEYANGSGQTQIGLATMGTGVDEEQREGNALLFSKALGMLDALKRISDLDPSPNSRDQRTLIAREMIAEVENGIQDARGV